MPYIKLPTDSHLIASDTNNVFFDGSGNAKNVDTSTIPEQTGKTFIYGTNGLVAFDATKDLTPTEIGKIKTFIGAISGFPMSLPISLSLMLPLIIKMYV